jgi:hypothetical protein
VVPLTQVEQVVELYAENGSHLLVPALGHDADAVEGNKRKHMLARACTMFVKIEANVRACLF